MPSCRSCTTTPVTTEAHQSETKIDRDIQFERSQCVLTTMRTAVLSPCRTETTPPKTPRLVTATNQNHETNNKSQKKYTTQAQMEHVLTAALCKCTQPTRIKWLHGVRGGERERERERETHCRGTRLGQQKQSHPRTRTQNLSTDRRNCEGVLNLELTTTIPTSHEGLRGPQEASGGGASGFQYQ
jgi:hypothetical protein